MSRSETREIRPLTSFRMIAAAWVLLHHWGHTYEYSRLSGYPDTPWYGRLEGEGYLGVTMFFVLSGFLITLRYYDSFERRDFNFYEYMVKRFARIYPLFLVVIWLSFRFNSARGDMENHWQRLVHYSAMQGLFSEYLPEVNGAAWSLTVEENFYLIAPLVFMTLAYTVQRFALWKSILTLLLWCVGLYAAGLLVIEFSNASGLVEFGGFMSDKPTVMVATIFGNFFIFAVGIFLAIVYKKLDLANYLQTEAGRRTALIGTLLCVGLMAYFVRLYNMDGGSQGTTIHFEQGSFSASYGNYVFAVITGVLILCLTAPGTIVYRVLSWEAFVYMGRISYALYLIQVTPIISYITNLPMPEPTLLRFIFIYAGMSLFSALLYELVENPAHKLILKVFLRRKARVEGQPASAFGD